MSSRSHLCEWKGDICQVILPFQVLQFLSERVLFVLQSTGNIENSHRKKISKQNIYVYKIFLLISKLVKFYLTLIQIFHFNLGLLKHLMNLFMSFLSLFFFFKLKLFLNKGPSLNKMQRKILFQKKLKKAQNPLTDIL